VSLPGKSSAAGTLANGSNELTHARIQVYKGSDEILLSKLILDPTHSILKQSFDSRLRLVRDSTPGEKVGNG
jgi:hypothetical protein